MPRSKNNITGSSLQGSAVANTLPLAVSQIKYFLQYTSTYRAVHESRWVVFLFDVPDGLLLGLTPGLTLAAAFYKDPTTKRKTFHHAQTKGTPQR